MLTRYFADQAWLSADKGVSRSVSIDVADGRIVDVTDDSVLHRDAIRLPGFVIPGMVNAHSHAFHRALRGRTHCGTGDFWSWRRQMYTVVERLSPQRYLDLARATYAEMVLAGITTVVEFHYVHHGRDGTPYENPAHMAAVLAQAAAEAGIRLVLLDTLYMQADVDGTALAGPQLRFADDDVHRWESRLEATTAIPGITVGAAIHSVRGAPPEAMRHVATTADRLNMPLHIHLSEQVKENESCLAVHGRTPTQLCDETGVLGPATSAVHATHLTDTDIRLLGSSSTVACFCPTTERDLADGIGPAARLREAGSLLSLGSDSHAVIDMFEEARAVELNERLQTMRRGGHSADALLSAATFGGAISAGLGGGVGEIKSGLSADLVAVDTDSVRLAGGVDPVAATVFAATAQDVTHVVVDGRLVVKDRAHLTVDDVACSLRTSIGRLYD